MGTSPLLKRQRCVVLCRLSAAVNLGPGAEQIMFVCFVFVHPVEKQTKMAVEVRREEHPHMTYSHLLLYILYFHSLFF